VNADCAGLGWLLGGGQDRDGPLAAEGKLTGKSPTSARQAAANPGG
jgi:hypothetical protein